MSRTSSRRVTLIRTLIVLGAVAGTIASILALYARNVLADRNPARDRVVFDDERPTVH